MPYVKETCVAGKTIEISKYFTYRFHRAETDRSPKEELTSEAVKRINNRNAIKRLRRILNTNFEDGDYLVRLDFQKEKVLGSEDMQIKTAKALRKIKTAYKKAGLTCKYVYVKEIGPRGSRHLHMVISKSSVELLAKNWPYGYIHVDILSSEGQYARIAEYFVKYSNKTELTEGKLIGKRWYGSRNLLKPKVTKQIISARDFLREPRSRKGYYIDINSIVSGICELTGYEYYSYTLIKPPE